MVFCAPALHETGLPTHLCGNLIVRQTGSRKQWQLAAVACTMGGNFRVGLEDNFYLPNNEMAKSNGECVEWGVKLATMMGREVATIEEARAQLKTPLKETV